MSLFICQFCGSERKNANAKSNHEIYCKENPNRKIPKGSPGKRSKNLEEVNTLENCSYGCGQLAKYRNKSGNLMCNTSASECPKIKKKNSEKNKLAYLSGKRLDQKTHYKNLPKETKKRMAWATGLSKETDKRVAKFAKTLSDNMKGKPGRPHNEKTKERLSKKRIEFLEHNSKHCNWFVVGGVKVQGTLEKSFAEFLLRNSIDFKRVRIKFQNHRIYTPDFYLPAYDVFIETKGFLI